MSRHSQKVSILLITWNALEYTKLCLESILNYTNYPYQLIIVDNGSTDGTQDYLRSVEASLILNDCNLGYSFAIQQAYEFVETEFVCTLNNDVVVSPAWLKTLVETYEKYPLVKQIGPLRPAPFFKHPYFGGSSKAVLEAIKNTVSIHRDPKDLLAQFCQRRSYEAFVEDFKRANDCGDHILESPPGMLSTCCALMETGILDKVGGIADLRFEMYGSDDIDLSWRISQAGYEIMYTNRVYVHHFEHASMEFDKAARVRLAQKNLRRFFEKWADTFWDYVRRKLNEGGNLNGIRRAYWLNDKILQLVCSEEIPFDIREQLGIA